MKYIKKYILLLLYYVKKVLTLLRDKCLPENENLNQYTYHHSNYIKKKS